MTLLRNQSNVMRIKKIKKDQVAIPTKLLPAPEANQTAERVQN
jgi:hypothetical protein